MTIETVGNEGVGTIVIGDPSGIREDEVNGESKNWGTHGNLDLHSWAFDRFTDLLAYKAEMDGISVEEVSERDTSTRVVVVSVRRTVWNAGCTRAIRAVRRRTRT